MGATGQWYDSRNQRWVFEGRDGKARLYIGENFIQLLEGHTGKTGTLENLNVGTLSRIENLIVGGESQITKIIRRVGTIPLTNVGTHSRAAATVYGGASGFSATGINVNDSVVINPRSALDGNLGIWGFVPTTDTVVAYLVNPEIAVGSQPAVGCDIIAFRS